MNIKLSMSILILVFIVTPSMTMATEGGSLGIYPDGLENYMSGALPSSGIYTINLKMHFSASGSCH